MYNHYKMNFQRLNWLYLRLLSVTGSLELVLKNFNIIPTEILIFFNGYYFKGVFWSQKYRRKWVQLQSQVQSRNQLHDHRAGRNLVDKKFLITEKFYEVKNKIIFLFSITETSYFALRLNVFDSIFSKQTINFQLWFKVVIIINSDLENSFYNDPRFVLSKRGKLSGPKSR